MAKSYFKNADAAIIVYNVNNRNSFEAIKFWLEEFQKHSRNYDANLPFKPILVLGNKTDLDSSFKQIPSKELKKFAKKGGFLANEISAKKNSGKEVQSAINKLIELLVELSKAKV